VSDRRADAVATLAALGVDAGALEAGRLDAAALAPRAAGPDAERLVIAVGDLGSPAAAAVLAALEPHVTGGARRALRRALYRLRQRGIALPERTPAAGAPAPSPAAGEPDVEGLVSTHDAVGDRLLWLVRRLPAGGSLVVAAQANEPEGLRDVQAVEMSRRQLREVRQQIARESGVVLVAAPWRTVDALLVEAHHRTAARGRERDYLRVRSDVTTEPAAAPAEPVSRHAAPVPTAEAPALVAAAAQLLEEPPFAGWAPPRDAAAPFVEAIAAVRDSPLVLSEVQQRERVRAVLRDAARALYPAEPTARRLEGSAYVLAERGRAAAARTALALAALLRARPEEAWESPFLSGLVERALGSLLSADIARRSEERRGALVATPGELRRARASSRPGRTPA
jgi:hypothetical protein